MAAFRHFSQREPWVQPSNAGEAAEKSILRERGVAGSREMGGEANRKLGGGQWNSVLDAITRLAHWLCAFPRCSSLKEPFLPRTFHYLLVAAGTDYHTLGGLKQQKRILSCFWGIEVQNRYRWAKMQVTTGPHCPQRPYADSVPCLFQLLVAASLPWLVTTPLPALPCGPSASS